MFVLIRAYTEITQGVTSRYIDRYIDSEGCMHLLRSDCVLNCLTNCFVLCDSAPTIAELPRYIGYSTSIKIIS